MMEEIFAIIILIFSAVVHEVAHGEMAWRLGDPTAKHAGRLTLNPLKHLDFFGSFLVPLFLLFSSGGKGPIFGWAKPVPINPYNFTDQKYGSAKVAFAGPASNFAIALVFGLILRFGSQTFLFSDFASIFSLIIFINLILALFNLIPIPPLDGSHILFAFLPLKYEKLKIFLTQFSIFILLFIIFFFFKLIIIVANLFFFLITGSFF